MIIKKSVMGIIVLAFTSIILTTGSPFQIVNNLFENNGLLYIKYLQAYAADDDDDKDIEEYNKEADEQHSDDDD